MEFKGTKGKWEYNGGDNYSIDIILPNDSEISLSRYNRYSDRLSMDRDEMQANALLISKAPELLEQLQSLTDLVIRKCNIGNDPGLSELFTEVQKSVQLIKSATTI